MRMPGAYRSNSSDRFSRLVFELLYSPPLNWALDSLSLGDRDNINFSSLCENLRDFDLLSKELFPKLELVLNCSPIYLHFKEVRNFSPYSSGSWLASNYNSYFCKLAGRRFDLLPGLDVVEFLGRFDSSLEVLRLVVGPYLS